MQNRSSFNSETGRWIPGPIDTKYISRAKFLSAYKAVQEDILELQLKYKTVIFNEEERSAYSEEFSPKNGRYEKLMIDVKKLREKYQLSPSFDRNIFYAVLGSADNWSQSDRGRTIFREHWFPYRFKNTGESIMVVPIYPETTIEDIRKFWPLITKAKRQFYNHTSERVIPRKNLERDIKIFKLKQAGMKTRDMLNKIRELYPKAAISYPDISRIIKRLKNMP